MSLKKPQSSMKRTSSVFVPAVNKTPLKQSKVRKTAQSPEMSYSQSRLNQESYAIRFKSKINSNPDRGIFNPGSYLAGQLSIEDVVNIKEVFDLYDSTGMGVLLPNDLKLLLSQHNFQANKKTVYEIVAQFDQEETGGISFNQFMKAMQTKPYLNETRKEIASIFKKYDRANKGYIDLNDLRQMNRHLNENKDEETLKTMMEKVDSNRDGKISFEDFYTVMVRTCY